MVFIQILLCLVFFSTKLACMLLCVAHFKFICFVLFQSSLTRAGHWRFFSFLTWENSIFILFYQSFFTKAGGFSGPCPKESYFQSWALFCIEKQPFYQRYRKCPALNLTFISWHFNVYQHLFSFLPFSTHWGVLNWQQLSWEYTEIKSKDSLLY